jgi:hypothetical protein
MTIRGKRHYLWRAVDPDGNVLDISTTNAETVKCLTAFIGMGILLEIRIIQIKKNKL